MESPDITLDQLKAHFRCGSETIARELDKCGLKTKSWDQRKHTEGTKSKISTTRIQSGVAKGDKNPNYGSKVRPWLEGEQHPLRQWHRENPDFGDRQRGVNNPIHKVLHLYEDPKYLERVTSGIRAHVRHKTGKTYEETYGVEKAREYKAKLQAASPGRLSKFQRRETWIEVWVRETLSRLGVHFIEQAPVGPFTVDFLVPSVALVIQADGDYWYGNPSVFPTLSSSQRKRRSLDYLCDQWAEDLGIQVLRLWEHDIKSNPSLCEARITEKIR